MAAGEMDQDALAARIVAELEGRGAADAIALVDLMRLEQHLTDSLRIVRDQIAGVIRRARSETGV